MKQYENCFSLKSGGTDCKYVDFSSPKKQKKDKRQIKINTPNTNFSDNDLNSSSPNVNKKEEVQL